MHYRELREIYSTFIFKEYSWEVKDGQLRLTFQYRTPPEHDFIHTLTINNLDYSNIINIDNFVFQIGLAEMPSYWKATCSPRIKVDAGNLSPQQSAWWHLLFIKGMGEYFFKNQIDFTQDDFLDIKSKENIVGGIHTKYLQNKNILIPIGGGKDSVVTAEILHNNYQIRGFLINPSKAALSVARIAGDKSPIIVQRVIDPYLMHLNNLGFLNGHIPFSASIAFISLLVAAVENYKYIAVSNERSANEGNVYYLGQEINHQYSKSLEFESEFNTYIRKFVSADIKYFSFLRPLYELQIAKLFSKMPKYFAEFLSCNKDQQSNLWCGHCPKCLSIALTLLPWTSSTTIENIFGFNPLVDPNNQELLMQMTGQIESKPFECVTTIKEAQIAEEMIKVGLSDGVRSFLNEWLDNPNAPDKFIKELRRVYVSRGNST